MERSKRFGLVLTPTEKAALQRLARRERISSAAVVRRLIWREAEQHGLVPPADQCVTQERLQEVRRA